MDDWKKVLRGPIRCQWDKIGMYPHHGIDLPLSALRSQWSSGIGEYYDLLPLIDWCRDRKMDVIMLLPLNETSPVDPSPYNAISSCALHPIFLSLEHLPFIPSYPALKDRLGELKRLNQGGRVQYREVYAKKLAWLKMYFNTVKQALLEDPSFQQFRKREEDWLETYALFKILKDKMGQTSWATWPKPYKAPTRKEMEFLLAEQAEEVLFHSALQFLCFEQLRSVKNYANLRGVFIQGDIPILVNLDSADVWGDPFFFDLTMSAGAPPDYFNSQGQHWGFPLFNWELMRRAKVNFSWWKTRIHYAEHFYDIFRIDHIVGFFRIWGIPWDKPATEGRFVPSDASLWIPQGREILEFIDSVSTMLPIGEDLGNVPGEVKDCLRSLGICGTKIIRWEKDQNRYTPYAEYPELSMTSVSTHDADTLRGWWQNCPDEAKLFAQFKGWNYAPNLRLDQVKEILRDSHHTPSLFHINLLQEYLALFPELVWPEVSDERINIPGTMNDKNWTYRFRLPVEAIVAHEGLRKAVDEIVGSQ